MSESNCIAPTVNDYSHFNLSHGYLPPQSSPEVTPLLQLDQLHILKPIIHNDEFLPRT